MVRWARRAGTRDFCPALAVLVGPVQISFLTGHLFSIDFVPVAQQAEQSVVPRRLSLNKCLWPHHTHILALLGSNYSNTATLNNEQINDIYILQTFQHVDALLFISKYLKVLKEKRF